jgi:anti-sigma factor RsiW
MNDYPCGGIQREQQLMLYVGGELPLWERLRIESHLRRCPTCREQQAQIQNTMQYVAAEVRGGSLPLWQAQGMMVSGSAVSGRFHGRPVSSTRLAALAAISAAIAALTSYMAAMYGDHLTPSHSAPLSHASMVASPSCETPAGKRDKPGKSCRNCVSSPPPPPKVTSH